MNGLIVIEYQGKRVLTTQQLSQVYETDIKNISNNFNRNQERFLEGRDFFTLEGDELKEFKGIHLNDESLKFVSKLYLWTDRGANRHCKILDTDKAWQQFDALEETYFNVRNGKESLERLSPEMQMFKLIFDSVAKTQLELIQTKELALDNKRTLALVKDTIVDRKDNWRENTNSMLNRIAQSLPNKDYKAVRYEAYAILEERAKCRLAVRVTRLKDRLKDSGATKTAINNINTMSVIEEDNKLREIFTSIVKEMTIKYVA